MSKVKKIDIPYLNQLTFIPTITIPFMIPTPSTEKSSITEAKQSDFIKRVKRTKSIMLAHKNRKQKNMLSSYFMQSPRKNNKYFTPISNSNSQLKKDSQNKTNDTTLMEQKLERLLFPPVHSSMPIDLKFNKKMKGKYQSLQIQFKDPKTQRDFNKMKDRLLAVIKQRGQYQEMKKNHHQINIQIQRQKVNLTQQKQTYIRGEVLYSLSPRFHFACQKQKSKKNRMIKIFKSFTQQSQNIRKIQEDIDRWEYRKAEDEHQLSSKYNF